MNQKLRQRHRRLIIFVAIFAPVVFTTALLTRPTPVTMTAMPALAGNKTDPRAVLLAEEHFALAGADLSARLFRSSDDSLNIELAPATGQAVRGADVLVYWHDGVAPGDKVLAGARLLGTLAGPQTRTFALPVSEPTGELLFYSLAQQTLYEQRWVLPEQ